MMDEVIEQVFKEADRRCLALGLQPGEYDRALKLLENGDTQRRDS